MDDACVLFKTTFTYETETDHVEEIQFEHPVYLTAFVVDSVHGPLPRCRLYARDVLCLSGSRFVPLFDGVPQSSTPFQIPKTVSDRVILRMDAKEFRLAVYGRNYVHPVKEVELPKVPMLSLGARKKHSGPYQGPHPLPYLHGFPRELSSVLNGLGQDGELTKEVHGIVFRAADELCRGLGIIAPASPGADHMEESLEPLGDPLELAALAKKAVRWMDGMTSLNGSTGRHSGTIEEGMLSLGLSVVLCSCRSTVLHFISAGGLASLIGIFQLRGATALMMRYLVCSVELISIVGGIVGSDALLGNWRYPPECKQVQKSTGVIHVPGIINTNLRKEEISSPSLPPGMIRSKKSTIDVDSENQRSKVDDLSKRKSSSRSKKEKRRKSKHKTSEKSSHGSVSRHYNESKREDRETKRHRHRRSTSEVKQPNDDSNKRQKLGHPLPPPNSNTSCIDLETHEGLIKTQSMYEILFDIAFQPRPKGIIDSVKRVLDRLNLFNCLSELQKTSTKLTELVIEANGKELELTFSELTPLLSCVDPCVAQIFDFMKDSIQKTNIDNNNNNDDNQNNKGFWSVQELDECFLESISGMESFRDLELVIKILCLPFYSLKDQRIKEDAKSEFLEHKASILQNTGSLLSLILACPNGLSFLNHHQDQIASMEKTGRLKDSPGDDLTTVQVKKDFQSRLAFLRKAQDCQQVIEKIIEADLESQDLNSAFEWIAEFFRSDAKHTEALSLAVQACPEFLLKLSQVMDHQTQKLMSLSTEDEVDSMKINRRIPVHVVPILHLLTELSNLCWSPGILTGFLQYSGQLQGSLEKEQELKEKALIAHQDQQSLSRILLSQLEVCRSYLTTGWSGLLSDLSSIFTPLNTQEDAIGLFKNDDQFGRVLMSFQILICVLNAVPHESLMASIYGSNLLPTLVKALKTAIMILKAGNADFMAAAMTGEFKNDLSLNKSISGSLKYLLRVLQTILSTSRALIRAKIDLKSTGCLESLIEAYFQLALMPESMLEILQKRVHNSEVLKCKSAISEILLIWLESNWTPSVLDLIFASNHTVNQSFSRPSRIFSNCCLLSDLFPEEWPPLPYQTQQRGFLTPPSKMKTRALLARGLECHNRAFKFLIEYGLGSESHIMRCMVVKLCAKAAGLGGGMGVFLVEPIMKELTSLIKNSGTPSDYYRLVEIVSGLIHWPAIKAAFLDSKLVSSISRLLHALAPDCEKDESLLAICSAFLDVFQSLLDPVIALDPLEKQDKRMQLDCPGSSELGVMVAALLANLSQFQSLEGKVLDLLKTTETLYEGRSILMRGISRWRIAYTNTTTEIQDEVLLQWAHDQLKKAHDSKPEHPCGQILEFLSSLTGACTNPPSRETAPINERPSAPARFKDLVQRTQERALLSNVNNTESEESGKLFWKFVHQFPTLQLRKKYEKLDCSETATNVCPTEFFNSGFLTASSRSRETLTQTFFQQVRDSVETVSSVSEKGGGSGMTQKELPPVLALPRRGQESRKGKTVVGTTSRLPSIHVDEYHKTTTPSANEGSAAENKDQTPRGVAQGMGQLSLQSTPKKASSESLAQPSTPLGMVQTKEERSKAEMVSIPGLGSNTSPLVIPGLGLEATPSIKNSGLNVKKASLEGGLDGSPLAPKSGSKTSQEESRRDSMMIDQTE